MIRKVMRTRTSDLQNSMLPITKEELLYIYLTNLPIIQLCTPDELDCNFKALNACLLQEANNNLKATQKELLRWHWKFGHLNLARTQAILKSGACSSNSMLKAVANLYLKDLRPLCSSCLFGKGKRQQSKLAKVASTAATPRDPTTKVEKVLSKDATIPGKKVSMDHFIVSTPGRLFSSRGRDSPDRSYKGGVIFVDHASGFVFVSPVVNFTAGEALQAKQEFEAEMATMGVTIVNYHSDNGVFTSSQFQDELAKMGQDLTLSGVGAHHQNAVAEQAIGMVVSMTRTMMLHAKMRWC